ncbi:type II toxin-antitoxin system HicB family antitoxin [Lactococcus insecticola]|uniref:HicB family protein n=1 Tax=Pseudolactococcus insecticola TaxID=2709158 RepID=A0A6A0BAG7_9LACT|nr:type II toxin-antitoxin system HicB family antitoxin [Lactococcus insecticola]GFH41448.1 HicB family protein [Lactococcus insecticola]
MYIDSLTKTYPAIFTHDEEGYFIEFPDLQGAYTGINNKDLSLGIAMAEEVLGMVLADRVENGEELPMPTDINKVKSEEDGFVTLIKVDMEKYFHDETLVKKTLTIPKWADDTAKRSGLNFSRLLTEAIGAKATELAFTREI